jgi:hypothetical protein
MGDLLSATPVIKAELDAGTRIVLLVFPQIRAFTDLIDFGSNRSNLEVCMLPVGNGVSGLREFFRRMSRESPELVWISPHAPIQASSWKIPLLLWMTKRRYWPKAILAGAASERGSRLFDSKLAVDRQLPYSLREWRAYSLLPQRAHALHAQRPSPARFIDRIQSARALPHLYDLLIHPGATANNRKWPYSKFPELLTQIPKSARLAVVGLPDDIEHMRAVLPKDRKVAYLTGNLESAITSIAQTRVALTMDSGTMFFANMLGVPTVALFGPSDPHNVIAEGGTVQPFYEPTWSCQPCRRVHCRQPSVFCMHSIDPAKVADKLLQLMHAAA